MARIQEPLVMLVYVSVKPEHREEFIVATEENARNSRREPGVARFELLEHGEDPNRFVLIEEYYNEQAPAEHKKTAHYLRWRETVAEMMAAPRDGVKYRVRSVGRENAGELW